MLGERRDLRQVGDAEHLAAPRRAPQPLADRACRLAADAGVDLVEHERRATRPRPRPSSARASRATARRPRRRRARARPARPGSARAGTRLARRRVGPDLVARLERDLEATRPPSRAPPARRAPAWPASAPPCARALPSVAASSSRSPRASASAASARSVATSACSSASRSARQRSAWASTASTLPPCLRSSRSYSSSRSSTSSQPAGIGLEALAVAAQLRTEVLGLQPQAAQPLRQRVQLGIDARRRPRPAARPPPARPRRRPRRPPARSPRPRRQRPPAARPRRAAARARPAASACSSSLGSELLDLLDLEREQVEVAIARAGALAQLAQLALQPRARARARRPGRSRSAQMLGAAEAVQQLQLRRGERQPPVLVLAEERDHAPAQRLQVRGRRRAALHERARAPLGPDAASQHDLLERRRRCARAGRPAPARRAGPAAARTPPRRTPRGARAHDPRARLAAEQQVERVGEHGLAGARLARERVQPRAGPQLGPIDQQQVLDPQLDKHAVRSTSAPRRSGRGFTLRAVAVRL